MEDEMKSTSETKAPEKHTYAYIICIKNSSYIVKKMIDTTVTRLISQRSF